MGAVSISDAHLKRLPLFLAVFFAAWTARIALIPWTDAAADTLATARIVADAWRVALWLVLPVLWCVVCEKISPRDAIDQRPGSMPWLGWAVAAAYLVASRALAMWGGENWHAIPLDDTGPTFFANLVGLAFVAVVEVFVFFGLVLKSLRARFGFWAANALAAALFAAIQVPGWVALIELDAPTLAILLGQVFLFGLLLGWSVRLTGAPLPAIFLHFLNNALAGLGFVA
jgi:membrane protease YdiL (CAAX protease family)